MSETAEDIIRVDTLQKNFLIEMREQLLKELREQIAQDIEHLFIHEWELGDNRINDMVRLCANVARRGLGK